MVLLLCFVWFCYFDTVANLERLERSYNAYTDENRFPELMLKGQWKNKDFSNKRKQYLQIINTFYGKYYRCENDMHADIVAAIMDVLRLLNSTEASRLVGVDIHNKKFLASVSTRRMDIVIGIRMFYRPDCTPAALSLQFLGEGEPAEREDQFFMEARQSQLIMYLDFVLRENRAERAHGILYNQYCVQFVVAKCNCECFISRKMSWRDKDCMKFLYFLAFSRDFAAGYKKVLRRPFSEFLHIGCFPRGVIGKGGSSIVFGVDYSDSFRKANPSGNKDSATNNSNSKSDSGSNSNSNSNKKSNKNKSKNKSKSKSRNSTSSNDAKVDDSDDEPTPEKSCRALKLYLKNDEMDNPPDIDIRKLHRNEVAIYQYLINQGDFNSFLRDVIVIYEKEQNDNNKYIKEREVKGLVMKLLKPIKRINKRFLFQLDILDSIKQLHGAGVFHLDLRWMNIMTTPGGILRIIDFQMSKKTKDIKNIYSLCRYFLIDIACLLALYGLQITNCEIKEWGNEYLRNKEWRVYDEVEQKMKQVCYM